MNDNSQLSEDLNYDSSPITKEDCLPGKRPPKQTSVQTANSIILIALKTVAMATAMTFFFIFRKQPLLQGFNPDLGCVTDFGVSLYTEGNDIINDPKNFFLRNCLMILSSVLIDLSLVAMCAIWYSFL